MLRALRVLGRSAVGLVCTVSSLTDRFGSMAFESFLLRLLGVLGTAESEPALLSVFSWEDCARSGVLAATTELSNVLAARRFGTLFWDIFRLVDRRGVAGAVSVLVTPGSRGSGLSEIGRLDTVIGGLFSNSRSFSDLDGGGLGKEFMKEACCMLVLIHGHKQPMSSY